MLLAELSSIAPFVDLLRYLHLWVKQNATRVAKVSDL